MKKFDVVFKEGKVIMEYYSLSELCKYLNENRFVMLTNANNGKTNIYNTSKILFVEEVE